MPFLESADIRSLIQSAARRRGGVLIVGEPGTGREAVGHAIHVASPRAAAPFVVVDCDASVDADVDLLLFGVPEPQGGNGWAGLIRLGRSSPLHEANGGTLFLRNPFDMALRSQARLGRLLHDGEAVRVGGRSRIEFDVRLLGAVDSGVQRHLEGDGVAHALRRRLSAIRIDLPPLRTRAAEIPGFAVLLIRQLCDERRVALKQLASPVLTFLAALPWRRNVAELYDLLDVLVRTVSESVIELEHVLRHVRLDRVRAAPVAVGTLREARMRFEREYVTAVLARHDGRVTSAAAELGLERANLYRKMRRLGVSARRA